MHLSTASSACLCQSWQQAWGEGVGSGRATAGLRHGQGQGSRHHGALGWGRRATGGLVNERGLMGGCIGLKVYMVLEIRDGGRRTDYLLLVGWFRSPLTKSLAKQYLPFWKNICSGPRGCIPHSAWETPQCFSVLPRLPLLKYLTWFYVDGYSQAQVSALGK